jgi:MRG-binding protein
MANSCWEGLHKHFRMISIQNSMRSHGFVSEDTPHTRISGVWRKLGALYDLRALDERENANTFHDQADPLDPAEAYNIPQFELPEEEYGELMWQRRFHGPDSVASSSPPLMSFEDDKVLFQPGMGLLRDLPEGARSQKTESVAGATPTPKNTKSTRASRAAAKGGKGGKAGQNVKNSKAVSESAEEEDEDEDEDEEEEDTAESEADTAPSTRRTNRSGGRAKPAPKRTRKR